jgi:hypothetical protein
MINPNGVDVGPSGVPLTITSRSGQSAAGTRPVVAPVQIRRMSDGDAR